MLDSTAEVVEDAEITADGIDLPAYGLKRPSSTWTYLSTDSTFGSDIESVVRRIGR